MNKRHNLRPSKNVPVTDSKSGEKRSLSAPISNRNWRPESPSLNNTNLNTEQNSSTVGTSVGASMGISPTARSPVENENSEMPEGALSESHAELTRPSAQGAKERKKPEYGNLCEYLEAVFIGKAKSLPDDVFNKLKIGSSVIPPGNRGNLLRFASENDPSLEKARQLFIYARRTGSYRAWGRAIREVARDVVLFHPVTRGCGSASHAFSSSQDELGTKQFWKELFPNGYNSAASGFSAKNEAPTPIAESTQLESSKETSKVLAKARRNAFLCSVLWRHGEGLEVASDLMRVYGETLFEHQADKNLEADLIDGLATIPEREEEKIAQVMAWAMSQTATYQARAADYAKKLQLSSESLESLRTAHSELEGRNQEGLQLIQSKEQELRGLANSISIQNTHSRADFESLRANSLGVIKSAVSELENVDVALSRENPKTEFARDVLKAVIDNLLEHVRKLDEKKS